MRRAVWNVGGLRLLLDYDRGAGGLDGSELPRYVARHFPHLYRGAAGPFGLAAGPMPPSFPASTGGGGFWSKVGSWAKTVGARVVDITAADWQAHRATSAPPPPAPPPQLAPGFWPNLNALPSWVLPSATVLAALLVIRGIVGSGRSKK